MEYIDEKELRNYPNIISFESAERILEQMKNKICNIKLTNGTLGTGFFCKIPFPTYDKLLPVLVTNNHIIDEKLLKNENGLIMIYTKESNKYQNFFLNNRKYFTSKEYDTTFIEIKESDEIHNFLELDDSILKSILDDSSISQDNLNNYYIGETIYIMQYPEGKLSVSFGILDEIKDEQKFNFSHLCSTKKGSSGSPILNIANNKLFGIHKKSSTKNNYNKGTFLNMPIKGFLMQNFNIKFSSSISKNMVVQNEIKKINEIKEIKKINEIKEIKEVNKIEEVRELKSMSLDEFNERYHLKVDSNSLNLELDSRKLGNDMLEIVYNLHLNNLKNIRFNYNNFSNIDILSKYQCYSLEILKLGHNKITNISVLQYVKFPDLKKLFLEENNISDISVFEKVNFENLEELSLHDNQISDINVLEKVNFPKLRILNLNNNRITDISILGRVRFKKLNALNLFSNGFSKNYYSSVIEHLKSYIEFVNV